MNAQSRVPYLNVHLYMYIYRYIRLSFALNLTMDASFSNWKKINKIQTSCVRTILGYVRSTPCPAIEVESTCPPFNIRCHWLVGKFFLKSLSYSDHHIFDIFYSLYLIGDMFPNLCLYYRL